MFQKAGDRAGALLAWSGLVDSYLYAWDAFAPLDAWIDWLSTAGPEAWPFPDARVDAAVATSMVGALIQRQPGHPRIAFWMQAALRVLRQGGEANARIRAGTYAALYCFWTGNFPLIREIARELKRMAEPPEASPLSVLGWKWVEACCLSCFQDVAPAKTLEIVRSALAHAEATGVHALDGMILAQAAIASIMQRDLAEADGYLDRMARASLGRNTLAYYHYLSSWKAFLGGDLPRAGMHVEEALRLARETGMVFSIILAEHACAEVSFECGQTEEADLHLQEAFRMAAQIQSDYFPFVCRLTQARFALRRSGRSEALGPLRMALIPGRTQGVLNAYWWIPEWMAELCQLALEERIEVPYVQRLVRARGLRPAVPPLHCTEWPWDLRIQTLGGFKVLRDGKALEHVKTPRRTLMLLQAIIAQGPEGAKETVLMDLLWPEASGDLAQQSLATCLHRLRQLLGVEGAITARGGRLWLDLQRCWVDAFAFERTCDPALYKGPFLPESEEGWVLPYRRRLEGIHCGVLGRGLAVTRG